MSTWGLSKFIKTKLHTIALAFTSSKAFQKNEKRSGTSLPTLFFP